MTNKLDILLECLPEAPFKEQLKQAINEKIEYEARKARTILGALYSRQGKSNLAPSIVEDNYKIQQAIMNKLREILQCKEGESILLVAKQVMKFPIYHGDWILQFAEEVFVVFNPEDDGFSILTATRTIYEAENYLQAYMEAA